MGSVQCAVRGLACSWRPNVAYKWLVCVFVAFESQGISNPSLLWVRISTLCIVGMKKVHVTIGHAMICLRSDAFLFCAFLSFFLSLGCPQPPSLRLLLFSQNARNNRSEPRWGQLVAQESRLARKELSCDSFRRVALRALRCTV